MRWLILFLGGLGIGLGLIYSYVINYPEKKYLQWMSGQNFDRYYQIEGYRSLLLSPPGVEAAPNFQEDYVQLWKEFSLENTLIPLPTRHPLFQPVPIIDLYSKASAPNLGMSFLDPKGREVSRVHNLPKSIYADHSMGQELFKLPYFRNRIRKKTRDEIWKDLFEFQIKPAKKSHDEMIYDLYLLHLRSKLLPKDTISYGLFKDGKLALIELSSPDKDYIVEVVTQQVNGTLYSYILKTEKRNSESMKLRDKFLHSIHFGAKDESLSRILYTEFKQLNYARQVDQEGMLYLFSAWSQNTDNIDLLKEMIFYLERGPNAKKQLKALYRYAYKKYGKTYTTRKDIAEGDDPDLVLQRNIEIEQREALIKAQEEAKLPPPVKDLSPDEKMEMYLKKAKENKVKQKEEMTVH